MKFSKVLSFLAFSGVTEIGNIERRFNEYHLKFKSQVPYWSSSSTRKKIVFDFWFNDVLKHFIALFGLGFISSYIFHPVKLLTPLAVTIYSLMFSVAYLICFTMIYVPTFHLKFAPFLDGYIENCFSEKNVEIHKCKRQQFSLKAIVIIQYVLQRMAGFSGKPNDEQYLKILSRQYGVSKQGLNIALQEIFEGKGKRDGERILTEIENSFEDAESYFTDMKEEKAIKIIDEVRQKLFWN